MNLLNKELIGIAVAIAILYGIQACLPKKKKEGFMDSSQTGVVVTAIVMLILIAAGIGYYSYQIKF